MRPVADFVCDQAGRVPQPNAILWEARRSPGFPPGSVTGVTKKSAVPTRKHGHAGADAAALLRSATGSHRHGQRGLLPRCCEDAKQRTDQNGRTKAQQQGKGDLQPKPEMVACCRRPVNGKRCHGLVPPGWNEQRMNSEGRPAGTGRHARPFSTAMHRREMLQLVPEVGLEPTCLAAADFESAASTIPPLGPFCVPPKTQRRFLQAPT